MRIAVYVLGGLLVVLLGLSACGGSGESSAPPAQTSAQAEETAAASDAPSPGIEEEIIEPEAYETVEPAAEAAPDADAMTLETPDMRMQMTSDGVRMQTDEATVTLQSGESVALPEDFPADVPLLDGMQITTVMEQTGEDDAILITAATSMALDDAAQAIAENAKANGWTEVTSVNQAGQMAIRAYEKGDRSWSATVINEDGKTLMNWAVSK